MKRFSLRLEDDLHEKLRRESFETGVSINEIIIKLVEEYYEEERNMKFYYGTLEFGLEDLENIETTDNYGNIDIGFEVNGRRFLILDIPFENSDIDEAGDDFTEEFYEATIFDAIDNNRIEEIKD